MTTSGNLIYQETTTTGTGNITLTAKAGFRAFSDQFSIAAPFWYCIRHQTSGAFEVGVGELSSASVLVRSSVIQSSNSNALVNFAAGTKDVICDVPASIQNYLSSAGIKATTSAGVLIESNSGTDVALMGAGGGAGATFYGGVNVDGVLHLTDGYAYMDFTTGGGTNLSSLYGPLFPTGDQANYLPDRSGELATVNTIVIDSLAAIDGGLNVTSLDPAGGVYPSLTEISYVKGVTSAIQTQLNAKPVKTQTQGAGSTISGALANADYIVAIRMPFGGIITETTTKCATGTATATFKVNTTALGGTANSVSTSEQSQAHASSNTFASGDDIVITISSNSACEDMTYMIKYTRDLD